MILSAWWRRWQAQAAHRRVALAALDRCIVALQLSDYELAGRELDAAEQIGAIRPSLIAYYRGLIVGEKYLSGAPNRYS